VPLGTSWLDYVDAIGSGVAAIATALAVIVALFGPGWRAKRRAPKLVVSADPARAALTLRHAQEMAVRIRNAPGRDTAEAAEVFVTVTQKSPRGVHYVAREESLSFDTPRPDAPGRSTASVPSGYSRPVSFAVFGPAEAVAEHFPPHKYAQNLDGHRDESAALSLCSVEHRKFLPLAGQGRDLRRRACRHGGQLRRCDISGTDQTQRGRGVGPNPGTTGWHANDAGPDSRLDRSPQVDVRFHLVRGIRALTSHADDGDDGSPGRVIEPSRHELLFDEPSTLCGSSPRLSHSLRACWFRSQSSPTLARPGHGSCISAVIARRSRRREGRDDRPRLAVTQRHEQHLWPALIALARVLVLPVAGIEEAIEREVDENPALERDDGIRECPATCAWCTRTGTTASDRAPDVAAPAADDLLADTRALLGAREARLAEYIVASIDDRGLLASSRDEIGRETGCAAISQTSRRQRGTLAGEVAASSRRIPASNTSTSGTCWRRVPDRDLNP
jgi:hypothetical protein